METTFTEESQTNVTLPELNEVLLQIPLVKKCLENEVFATLSIVVPSVTFLPTLFGNLLLIIAIRKFKEFHKGVSHKFVFQVAVADLFLLVVLITYPIELAQPSYFKMPNVCLIRTIFTYLSLSVSITFLTLISSDRFFAVKYPIRYAIESKKSLWIYVLIGIVWVLSITTSVIVIKLNVFQLYSYDGLIDGCPLAWYSVENLLVISSSFIVVSFITNFSVYSYVIYKLFRRNTQFNAETKRRQMSKTKLALFIYAIFTISWLPLVICQVWLYISTDKSGVKCYREYSFLFGFANSSMNWIFYGIGNEKYRSAFKKLIKCSTCKKNNIVDVSST